METSWHSFPSVYAMGHAAVADLLLDPVLVEEKVDGSQFSFGHFPGHPDWPDGWQFRSKGATIQPLAPPDMFKGACSFARTLDVKPGWTYRAEVLAKPKHNVLAYERTPKGNLILFDINPAQEVYLTRPEKEAEAARLGLEIVPVLHDGMVENVEQFRSFLDRTSILGGQKIEGVVVKNYKRFGRDKKALMGKFVSEAFKEVHAAEWKSSNPTSSDIVQQAIARYRTPARWAKALQHLRDAGQIEGSPRDIGLLMKEVPEDTLKECEQEMKDFVWAWAWGHIRRGLGHGLPEWYKQVLLESQFGPPPAETGEMP